MWEYPNRPEPENPYASSSIHAFGFELSHADHNSRSQKKQRPHAIVKGTTTRSPILNFVMSGPTATISPMNSWPRISPRFRVGIKPSSRCRSEPQIAVSVTLTIASRGLRILGSGTRETRTSLTPYQQRAFIDDACQWPVARGQ